ncbi:hypothetical protein ACLKA7_006490 [Drosophila subpalustris]
MPAGIVKTPNSGRAKDANAAKSAERSANNTGSGGKKFVQTRLPFKLITPVAKTAAGATASSATAASAASPVAAASPTVVVVDVDEVEREREPRKRKLSYGCEQPSETEQLRRSNSKENLQLGVAALTPNKKAKTVESEDVIELIDDDDDDDEDEDETKKEKPAENVGHPSPVQIKLPLNSRRSKRRKSLKKPEAVEKAPPAKNPLPVERSDSSDDIEAIAEQLNPQKRPKVVETDAESKKQQEPESKSNAKKMVKELKDEESKMDVDSDEPLLESDDAAAEEHSGTDVDTDTQKNKTSPEVEDKHEKGKEYKTQNLTAKQLKLMEQRRKAREEKERRLQEERRLKQQEKEQREQLKKAEREQKEEQRRKEREDKEQVKRQEREQKERKRQAEVDKKDEEKRKRNEAKEEVQRKKDDERRRKEQEKEEAEQKKKRAAASFTKFFVPKQPRQSLGGSLDQDQNSCDSGPSNGNSQSLAFRPFQIKDHVIMAPVIRATIASDTRRQLDRLFREDDDDPDAEEADDLNEGIGRVKRPTRNQLYLGELRLARHKPLSSKRDVRLQRRAKDEEEDDDVQVIDDLASAGTPIVEERAKQLPWMRAKYLHFADNRRPPYYGTWRKRSQLICARRPLGQDKAHFDYEVDSDCEWEEEEPGESLSASEDEKERESEEESEEEYNEWFVPHGHLSDEELQNDGELEDGNTREAQKAKLQVLQQEFAQEMKKQTKKIKPRLLGPVWLDENGNKSQLCPAVFTQTIDMYGCWQLQPLTLEPPPEQVREEEPLEEMMQLDEPLLQQLVRLIHGNRNSKVFLISEYLEFLKTQMTPKTQTLPPKSLLREKFDELASWKPVVLDTGGDAKKSKKPKKRLCWVVNAEMLQKHKLDELTLQNQWNYTLTPKFSMADTSLRDPSPPPTPAAESTEANPPAKSNPDTQKSTKPTTPTTSSTAPAPTGAAATGGKKRGTLLMSVARDQQFHAPTKNALISQYLRRQNDESTVADGKTSASASSSASPAPPSAAISSEDVVLLSD